MYHPYLSALKEHKTRKDVARSTGGQIYSTLSYYLIFLQEFSAGKKKKRKFIGLDGATRPFYFIHKCSPVRTFVYQYSFNANTTQIIFY